LGSHSYGHVRPITNRRFLKIGAMLPQKALRLKEMRQTIIITNGLDQDPQNGAGGHADSPESLRFTKNGAESQQDYRHDLAGDSQNAASYFEREDWTLFRTLSTLSQKAGVPVALLPRLVCKELTDNGLDEASTCEVGLLDGDGFFIEDDGDGIPGTDAEIAALFSIRRPLTSSKLLRLPTRGALGNGLRVVTGAVLGSGGSLVVATRGRTLRLVPLDDGTTQAEVVGDYHEQGTRIEVRLGLPLVVDESTLNWAEWAILLAEGGPKYKGKTSPHWYDTDAFFELLRASGRRTVRELIVEFDGCAEPKAGKIAAPFKGRLARDLGRAEAARLLEIARENARPVRTNRLGCVGMIEGLPTGYAKVDGAMVVHTAADGLKTYVPVVIEAWAELDDEADVCVLVNRTPVAAEIDASHHKDMLFISGCGLNHKFRVGRTPVCVVVNIETPHMPITSDGKTPDLAPVVGDIASLISKIVKKVKKTAVGASKATSQKDVILRRLDESVAKASGDSRYRFSLRQLFYAVRPFVLDALGKEPEYDYFAQVITERESDHGEIAGMYRDPRGTLYHPHTGEEIPLGTLAVERYQRPTWTFNKVLYCEKEGFFPILREVCWPEQNDCALMSAKGFASRAARDVLDMLGDSAEDLYFFCIHDADAYGTLIYQALQEGTQARPGRRVQIVNLGLEPEEALAMGLQVEEVRRKGDKAAPVAQYVEPRWRDWLQDRRVELNAMTTPQFLAWLDEKFASHVGKVVPPTGVLMDRLEKSARAELERRVTNRFLRRARIEERVERLLLKREPVLRSHTETIEEFVRDGLEASPELPWEQPVDHLGSAIAKGVARESS
jgi:hypothetical protein